MRMRETLHVIRNDIGKATINEMAVILAVGVHDMLTEGLRSQANSKTLKGVHV